MSQETMDQRDFQWACDHVTKMSLDLVAMEIHQTNPEWGTISRV